jgi:hypothetical protein
MDSEGVAQREINMHVRHSTRETTMQYQEINAHTENMRHKALMPDRKKVEQFIRERHERVMKKAPAKAIVFVPDTFSNVTVPLEMTSFDMPAKRLQQQSLHCEPLILLSQKSDTIQSNRCQAAPTSRPGTPHEVFGRNTKQVIDPNSMAKKQKNGMTQPQFAKNFDKFIQSQNAINGINPRAMNQKQLNLKQPQFNMNNGHINNQGNWANNQDNTRTSRDSQNIFNQSNDFAHHNYWNCNHGNYHCNNQNVSLPPQGHGYSNRNGFGNNENAPSNFGPPVTIINNYTNNKYAAAPPPVKSGAIKRNFEHENSLDLCDTDSDEY